MSNDLFAALWSMDDQSDARDKYSRAPFGYVGSKLKSLEHILPKLPYRGSYVEVCGGSGVVLLNRKQSKLEVFNDKSAGVTSFYRCIRDSIKKEKLIERIELTQNSREEFNWAKETWEKEEDDLERAAKWYTVMQLSHSNLGKQFARSTHSRGTLRIHSQLPLFTPVHYRFKNVQIETLDFRTCIRDYDGHNTVFYVDPPYLNSSNQIYECKFYREDHVALLDLIHQSAGFFAVSGYADPLYEKYNWDEVVRWKIYNSMVAHTTGGSRTEATEVLYIKEAR